MPTIVEIVAIWFAVSFPLGMVVGKILRFRAPADPLGPVVELSQVDLRPLRWLGSCMLVTSEESAQR